MSSAKRVTSERQRLVAIKVQTVDYWPKSIKLVMSWRLPGNNTKRVLLPSASTTAAIFVVGRRAIADGLF